MCTQKRLSPLLLFSYSWILRQVNTVKSIRLHSSVPSHQSDLSFFLPPPPPIGTLLTTAEPTAVTPPATAHTPPFTSPTLMPGTAATEVTAVLVRSRLFPPIQVTPLNVAPIAPLVTPYKPPVNRPNMPGCVCGWSLLLSDFKAEKQKRLSFKDMRNAMLCQIPYLITSGFSELLQSCYSYHWESYANWEHAHLFI